MSIVAASATYNLYVTNNLANSVTPISDAAAPGPPIPVGRYPNGIITAAGGTKAYAANFGAGNVTPIDLRTNTPGAAIPVGNSPAFFAADPSGTTIYVSNFKGQSLTPIDTVSDTAGAPIYAGSGPNELAISSADIAYVPDSGTNLLLPIDLATGQEQPAIRVGGWPFQVALTPDEAMAYVTNATSNSVTPILLGSDTALPAIPVGTEPLGITMDTTGTTAYVADYASNQVTPINLVTNTAEPPIPVGAEPYDMALSPDGRTLYVADYGANEITPIDTTTNTPEASIDAGSTPLAIAIAPPTSSQSDPGPSAPTLISPVDGGTVGADAPQLFTIDAADPDGDPYTGTVTITDSTGRVVTTFHTAPATSGSQSTGSPGVPLQPGSYDWSAAATDIHGVTGPPSVSRPFSVSGPPNDGGGQIAGSVAFSQPVPPATQPCAPTSFTFAGSSEAAVVNLALTAYAGPVSVTGSGGSACELTSAGQGNLTVYATGMNAAGSRLDCGPLIGGYVRVASDVTVALSGSCTINNFATADVSFDARVEFVPTTPGGGVTEPISDADFAGGFTVAPAS